MDRFDFELNKDEIKLMKTLDMCAFNQNERFAKIFEPIKSIIVSSSVSDLSNDNSKNTAIPDSSRKKISLDLGKKKTQALSPDPLHNAEPSKCLNVPNKSDKSDLSK